MWRETPKNIFFCVMIKNHSLDKTQFIQGIAFNRTNQVYHMMMSRNNVVCGIKCSNYDTVSMQTL